MRKSEEKSQFHRANATRGSEQEGKGTSRARPSSGTGDTSISAAPSLLLRRPLHRLLDLLLLLLARNLRHLGYLPLAGGYRALRGQHHHGGHFGHGGHLVAHEPLGAVAGGALGAVAGALGAVAGGALGAVAASVLTGAHFWGWLASWGIEEFAVNSAFTSVPSRIWGFVPSSLPSLGLFSRS